ncbi:zinc ribbon domain-containing protein YjdM [Peptostreptococcus faecalis]|uniref:zinc ribbon domain-containing protein YjdM n=1 Tax=Peptostreptococcus faecalis TaxID=2045015 RepID=UPI000C7AF1BA|nr:zinc ribbon domain-containing protein YjdM [Peptostreptococcus faecalis]
MSNLPNCPKCNSEYTYDDGFMIVCPECGNEIPRNGGEVVEDVKIFRDTHGNELKDGDSVTVIKDLKVKGSSDVIKRGTIVKNIKLKEGDHDVDCRIPGFGNIELKTEFLKKV